MPIDRDLVANFLAKIEANVVSAIESKADRLEGHHKLVGKFHAECAAWQAESVDHVRGITEAVNELYFAKLVLEDPKVFRVEYEPSIPDTNKTIDFLVHPKEQEVQIYYDVKTVHPEARNAWKRYVRFLNQKLFTPRTDLILDEEWIGGEIAHNLFASREKFLEYSLELEAKIRSVGKQENNVFRMVFCSNGFQWKDDHLEDFADFYFNGHPRPDDTFGVAQKHYLVENAIELDRSISGFCYLERSKPSTVITAFKMDVRGPQLPH